MAKPVSNNNFELLLNRTWKPTLSIVGADDIPEISSAGNVLRPRSTLLLSFRIPPKVDSKKAAIKLKELLEKEPPYNSNIEVEITSAGDGWHAPILSDL